MQKGDILKVKLDLRNNQNIELENLVYEQVSQIIQQKKENVKLSINSQMVAMYWNIGRILYENVLEKEKADYGKKIIEYTSIRLRQEYGNGFNRAALFRMIQFYRTFSDAEIVATLSRQLSWSHFVELISIKDDIKREFYTTMCINEKWDIRTLRERKKSLLFERKAISKKADLTILGDLKKLKDDKRMSIDLFLKDTYSEKDLEKAILNELEHFILEMGSDFAFLAKQKHFILDGKDYYIDLLFYHRTLRRLVAIELKLGEFEPEYKGQVELYLRWLDKYEKAEGEDSPLALILCAGKSDDVIELLDLNNGNIRVGQYLTKLPPKELLEKKLKQAIIKAKGIIDVKNAK